MKKLLITLLSMTFAVWMPCMAQMSQKEGNKSEEQSEEIFQVVEKMPEFPGGLQELNNFLQLNLVYPQAAAEKGVQGRVIVQFVVESDGSLTNVEVGRSVDSLLNTEAIRVVRLMPKWTPGEQRGKNVRVRYTLPVTFRLGDEVKEMIAKKVEDENGVQEQLKIQDEEIPEVVELMPEFPGGVQNLMKFLQKNLRYPVIAAANGVQGRVIVQFVVDKDGSVIDPVVLRSVDPYLDAEALRIISVMPKWKPGQQRGETVRVKYTLPIQFHLKEGKSRDRRTAKEINQRYTPSRY